MGAKRALGIEPSAARAAQGMREARPRGRNKARSSLLCRLSEAAAKASLRTRLDGRKKLCRACAGNPHRA
jgi:hypothetical protein